MIRYTRFLAQGQQTSAPSGVQELSDAEFSRVLTAPKAVVKFYSPNCPYSRKFAPIYEALAAQYPDVLFAAVDILRHVQQAGANQVQMLPTVVFFANGKAVGRIDGVQEQADFVGEMGRAFSGAPAGAQASPSQRSGTLVDVEASAGSAVPYLIGGGIAAGLLVAGYFLFAAK